MLYDLTHSFPDTRACFSLLDLRWTLQQQLECWPQIVQVSAQLFFCDDDLTYSFPTVRAFASFVRLTSGIADRCLVELIVQM
jgi:hypothetical protein